MSAAWQRKEGKNPKGGLNAATGPWKVTTGAGAAVLAVGLFSK